ncbi:SCO4225 family membrane protein [Massilia horti]|uniref:SCO4225 family membrane protein n=1 Tax=Massilia horti TaxID=2562153 RepID=UPI00351D38A8
MTIATTYLIVVLLAGGWALYTDLTLLHSQREHLAPDILLLIVTLPLSSSLTYLYDALPAFFSGPVAQVSWLTCCGLVQTYVLFALARIFQKSVDVHRPQ